MWKKYTGSDVVIAVVASIRMGRHFFRAVNVYHVLMLVIYGNYFL